MSLTCLQEEEEDEEALAEKFSEAFNQCDIDSEGRYTNITRVYFKSINSTIKNFQGSAWETQ